MGKGDTNISLKGPDAVLEHDQLGSAKHHFQVGEELAHFSVMRGQVFKAPGFLELRFFHPVEREPVQQGGVEFATPNFEELSFEGLIRLLEEGQQNPSSDRIEAHPQLLPLTLSLEEVQKDIH